MGADLTDPVRVILVKDSHRKTTTNKNYGRIDLGKVSRHWDDGARLARSLHTGAVRAYDTLRVLQRDGKPTALGEAVAIYGRIDKSLHMLAVLDDEAYRRQISNQLSIQESRHALARRVFHGQRGELRQRYR